MKKTLKIYVKGPGDLLYCSGVTHSIFGARLRILLGLPLSSTTGQKVFVARRSVQAILEEL